MLRLSPHSLFPGLVAIGLAFSPAGAQQATDAVMPERTQDMAEARQAVTSQDWMIAAAHPLAAEAGAEVLRQGGNAIDAMVAAQAMLGLVEPQSSGLGGGAFLVYYDAAAGAVTTLDGRETAPLAATPALFLGEDGQPLEFKTAVIGGLSVGVPGTPKLLETAHEKWGSKEWAPLFDAAIATAERGFEISPRLAGAIADEGEDLGRDPATRAYFQTEDGSAKAEGTLLVNPEYAETLRTIASEGTDPLYTGPLAQNIVAAVKGASWNPGVLEARDLAAYEVKERPAVCQSYRAYEVCGMGPPSSGAIAVGQILGILENFDLKGYGRHNPEAWRLIGDASRLAFADRGKYVADSDYVPVPVEGLLAKEYLSERAALLDRDDALESVEPGNPAFKHALLWGQDTSDEIPSTSHISIVDAQGNAVSLTTTIEGAFGAHIMANGYLLNNELTDFSFETHDEGNPIANRVEPGKRPRSSMAPTIVLEDGKPAMVVGSPGGSRIIGYVVNAILGMAEWDLDAQEAAGAPHFVNRFGTFDIEQNTEATQIEADLQAMGFQTSVQDLNSGLHIIRITEEGLTGGADPRREGVAIGE